MTRLAGFFLAVIVGVALTSNSVVAQAPVPDAPPGFVYKASSVDVPVHLEAWVDLVCPDSKKQFHVYQQIVDSYGPDKVRFDALMFPLPYHRAAMTGAQVCLLYDILKVYSFIEDIN